MPFTVAQPETSRAESNIPSNSFARIIISFDLKNREYLVKMNLCLPNGNFPDFRGKPNKLRISSVFDFPCR
jgi:hypothetical protein